MLTGSRPCDAPGQFTKCEQKRTGANRHTQAKTAPPTVKPVTATTVGKARVYGGPAFRQEKTSQTVTCFFPSNVNSWSSPSPSTSILTVSPGLMAPNRICSEMASSMSR